MQGAITTGVYYARVYFTTSLGAQEIAAASGPALLGYGIMPALFAFICFGFAGKMERFLLGGAANERVDLGGVSAGGLLRTGAKLIGVYLIATYLGSLAATVYEFVAVHGGNTHFQSAQVTSDLIASGLGVLVGYFLCCHAARLVKAIEADTT